MSAQWCERVTAAALARYAPDAVKARAAAAVRPARALEPLAPGDRTPRNLPSTQRAAEAAGWTVSVAALGDGIGTWHALLARHDGKVVLVCWIDGRFDAAVYGRAGRLLGSLGFREVGACFQ